jgi:hypothetical protein
MFGIKKLKERIKWLEDDRNSLYDRLRKLEHPPKFKELDQFTILGRSGEIYTIMSKDWKHVYGYSKTWVYKMINRVNLNILEVSQFEITDWNNRYTLLETK